MKKLRGRALARFAATSALAACGFSAAGCGSSPPARSAAAVCKVWNTDAVALHDKYAKDSAGGGGLTAFLDVVSAPNDLGNLMQKMANVAPNDIEPEFQSLADALHRASHSSSDAAAHPLAALASGLVNGLAVTGAEQAVNNYINTNCAGSPGTSTVAAANPSGSGSSTSGSGSTSSGSEACTSASPSATDPGYQSDGSSPADPLVDQGPLVGLDALDSALQQAAKTVPQAATVLSGIEAETPAASSSLEALARLRWSDPDLTSQLSAVDSAIQASCGSPLLGSTAVSDISSTVPAPDGPNGADLLGAGDYSTIQWPTVGCKNSGALGMAPPFTEVYSCDTGAVAVDLATGDTTRLPDLLPPGGGTDNGNSLTLAGSDVAWVSVDEKPASGLTAATWTSTLHVQPVSGGPATTKVLQANQTSVQSDGTPTGVASVQAGGPTWLLISGLGTDYSDLTLTDLQGNVVTHAEFSNNDYKVVPMGMIMIGDEPNSFLDVTAGKVSYLSGGSTDGGYNDPATFGDGGCSATVVAADESFGDQPSIAVRFTRGPGGIVASPVAHDTMYTTAYGDDRPADVAAVTPVGVVTGSDNGTYTFKDWAGKTKWTLSSPVVTGIATALGHIVATNTSGQQIIVDPQTGKQMDLAPDVTAAIDAIAASNHSSDVIDQVSDVALVDPSSDTLVYTTNADSKTVAHKISYSSVCS